MKWTEQSVDNMKSLKKKTKTKFSFHLTQLQINTRVTSHISSHGNQGEKEEARLRDFHIGY